VTPGRIVVVDDHAGFRATVRRLLEADGWEVVGEAADGRSAIGCIAELEPDVVLVDIGLPDIDGFAVADRLGGPPGPAVVLISSRDAASYGGRIAASRARGFLAKADLDVGALRAVLTGQPR
jgi:DNA-binding NarL/FixJ family response regulator